MWSGRNLPRCLKNIPSSFSHFSWIVLAPNDLLAVLCPFLVNLYYQWSSTSFHMYFLAHQQGPFFVPPFPTCFHAELCPFLLSLYRTLSFPVQLNLHLCTPHPSLGCIGQSSSSVITYHWAVSLFLSLHLFPSFSSAAYLSTVNT